MNIISHGYELYTACDVCGKKYVHKFFSGVKAGHLTVCRNPECIIHAMHETWVPKLALSDEEINDVISKYSKRPVSIVDFHTDIARGVFQVFANPSLLTLPDIMLLEAIVANEFAYNTAKEIVEYAQTIDVMYKPLWIPIGRKCIDTNYPFASVAASSAGGLVTPGVLHENWKHVDSNGYPNGKFKPYKCDPEAIAAMSGLHIPGCPILPVCKGTILLGQLFLRDIGEYETIFDNEERFLKFAKVGLFDKKKSKRDGSEFYKSIMRIADDEGATYFQKQGRMVINFNDVQDDITSG